MAGIRSLVKDTAVYGLSSIIGRFLNWGLVPLYAYTFPAEKYGIVSFLYSFTAVALVILNYGMETGFFRFVNRTDDPERVYTTSLWSLTFTSSLFIVLLTVFLPQVSVALKLPAHHDYVWLLGTIVAIDAFTNLPFAYLRYKNKAWTFAGIKFLNIGVNIGLNLFFILLCPRINAAYPELIGWFYEPLGGEAYGIGWIFVANLISTLVVLGALVPYFGGRRWRFDAEVLHKMLDYSWPLLILGVAGIMSQNMGQLLIPYLFPGNEEGARTMVGIYGANIKIAIVMVMFTQAFRYAYEPFIFSQAKADGQSRKQAYCDAMKYFVIFGLLIFIGVMYFLPVLRHFIAPSYWGGLRIVPVMMMAELFFGIFFNLSLWYKLTDRTRWGMYFSLFGFVLMFGLNVWLVPLIGLPDGYIGSAWAAFISYFAMMVVSWIAGRYYYPLPYQTGRMILYAVLAMGLYAAGEALEFPSMMWLTYLSRVALLGIYLAVVVLNENIPGLTPRARRLWHKAFPLKSKEGKRSNISAVSAGFAEWLTPRSFKRNERDMLLEGWEERPDADYIRSRVDFYCRRRYADGVAACDGIEGESTPALRPDGDSYRKDITAGAGNMRVWETTAGAVRPGHFASHYVYDLMRALRAWPAETRLRFCDGDNWSNPRLPAIVKTRRLDSPDIDNGIIMNMDSRRHFLRPRDVIPFRRKKPKMIFRGACAGKPERLRFLEMWKNSELMELCDTSPSAEGKTPGMTPLTEHFEYQFVLCPEGYDVSSALEWVMASGCVPVMPRPRAEGWLMHSLLEPGVHYVEIAPDFHDAEDKLRYYIEHPEEAESISKASREWVCQFFNEEREKIISYLVLTKYFGK